MTALREPTAAPPVVVVGASAGGVEALRDFVTALPRDLGACVLVVLHLPPDAPSALPRILQRVGTLEVRQVQDGDLLTPGVLMVAPPNHHLLVLDGAVGLSRGPQENGHRPAVDVLFRSAARAHGPRTMGVVLSGTLDDGAAGCVAIAGRGGQVVVQDPAEAMYGAMPRAAAAAVPEAKALPVEDMGPMITKWVEQVPRADDLGQEGLSRISREMEREVRMADLDAHAMHDPDRPGVPAGFGCPDCAGALFQIDEGGLRRYRCRVGHAWSAESLLARQSIAMESALWMALRSLEEKSALNEDLSRRAGETGQNHTARRFAENASEARRAAELVRALVSELDTRSGLGGDVMDDGEPATTS